MLNDCFSVPAHSGSLVADNAACLRRALDTMEGLSDHDYRQPVAAVFNASPGAHFRHIQEHYQVFLDSWQSGLVNYDSRPRNRQLECDRSLAMEALAASCRSLQELPEDLSQAVGVCCCTARDGIGSDSPTVPSCLSRELMFLHSHAIHHFAMVVIMLQQLGLDVHQDLGVAPATLRHQRQCVR